MHVYVSSLKDPYVSSVVFLVQTTSLPINLKIIIVQFLDDYIKFSLFSKCLHSYTCLGFTHVEC